MKNVQNSQKEKIQWTPYIHHPNLTMVKILPHLLNLSLFPFYLTCRNNLKQLPDGISYTYRHLLNIDYFLQDQKAIITPNIINSHISMIASSFHLTTD